MFHVFERVPLVYKYAIGAMLIVVAAACGGTTTSGSEEARPLTVSAIPDQDPEVLTRIYGLLTDHLSEELGVEVEYAPVTDYAASVSLFRSGDLDLVWFGGLTGVQARIQTPGARALAQRNIDAEFHSVFIASADSGIEPVSDLAGLSVLKGRRFTFGSESSTSGRLLPEHFLNVAGVDTDDFAGEVGFSGSHDRTIELVSSGSYEAGVLNEQVWLARTQDGSVDPERVHVIFRSPPYHDWVVGPEVDESFGDGFSDRIAQVLLDLDPTDPAEAEILEAFGAEGFITTEDSNYQEIEDVARSLGLIE